MFHLSSWKNGIERERVRERMSWQKRWSGYWLIRVFRPCNIEKHRGQKVSSAGNARSRRRQMILRINFSFRFHSLIAVTQHTLCFIVCMLRINMPFNGISNVSSESEIWTHSSGICLYAAQIFRATQISRIKSQISARCQAPSYTHTNTIEPISLPWEQQLSLV